MLERATVGVDDAGGPPVPIPNTEVKPCSAEDTWLVTAWENRKVPTQRELPPNRVVVFFYTDFLRRRTPEDVYRLRVFCLSFFVFDSVQGDSYFVACFVFFKFSVYILKRGNSYAVDSCYNVIALSICISKRTIFVDIFD